MAGLQRRRLDHDTQPDLTCSLPVINLAADQECEGRGKPLLEQHADFTLTIDLAPERCHSELVFGAKGCGCFALAGAHGTVGGDEGLKVESDVDCRGKLLVVGRLEDALGLELGRGDPLFADTSVDARSGGDRGGRARCGQ